MKNVEVELFRISVIVDFIAEIVIRKERRGICFLYDIPFQILLPYYGFIFHIAERQDAYCGDLLVCIYMENAFGYSGR